MILWFTYGIYSLSTADQEIGNVKKSLQAVKAENPPAIDGRLDDSCWQNSPQATGFIDRFTGKPEEDQTVAWLLYDDKALYVAFKAFESQPDKIIGRQTKDPNGRGCKMERNDFEFFQNSGYLMLGKVLTDEELTRYLQHPDPEVRAFYGNLNEKTRLYMAAFDVL